MSKTSDFSQYRVIHSERDELHPEETLADTLSEHSSVEAPIGQGVFRFFYGLAAGLILLLLVKSVQLQVYDGQRYAAAVARNSYANYLGSALRGLIYDR